MARVLAVGRAAAADGAGGGDVVQAMRKAPLSRALAKSREERKRDEVREVDKRQAAQGSNTRVAKYDIF